MIMQVDVHVIKAAKIDKLINKLPVSYPKGQIAVLMSGRLRSDLAIRLS